MQMFKNREFKRYTWRYVLVTVILGVLLFVLLKLGIGSLEQSYLKELETLGQGTGILEKQGYLDYRMIDYHADIRLRMWCLYGTVYGLYVLLALAGYVLGALSYRRVLGTIRQAGAVSDRVLAGRAGEAMADIPGSDMEGDIGVFWEAYEKMVTAIAQSKEDEKKEKLFLQDLIADISHQLKTPLATLTIYQDLLSQDSLSEDARRDMLSKMGSQLTRMEWLVLNLLKLARLEAGSIRFEPEKQNLKQTLVLARENVRMLEEAKGQHIELRCDEGIELVHDREWTVEALTNILKNATEYAPKDSRIEVWAEQSSVLTEIHIKDYGIGISEDDIHKVFKRFYRAKSKVNENSIGIGLSLSKSIINGQGGEIYVESVPGQYTCFTVAF